MKIKRPVNWQLWAIGGGALLATAGIVALAIWFWAPRFELLGEDRIELAYGEEYEELGHRAHLRGNDIGHHVSVSGEVDASQLGEYILEYRLKYLHHDQTLMRTVAVVDKESPVIELEGDNPAKVCVGKHYDEQGFSAQDNYDGDLTDRVERGELVDQVAYVVADSSGNQTVVRRALEPYTDNQPVLELSGPAVVQLVVGYAFAEPGFAASDVCDGDISSQVKVESYVDSATIGTYKVKYSVANSNQQSVTIERTVTVRPQPLDEKGVIYLTFDDGPSNLTTQVLDILKSEGVKATFFVINRSDSLNSVIRRAYDEGHAIGLHSASHNYNQIYASEAAFFNDMEIIRTKVEGIIGRKVNIMRFPGGSSNTVSRFNPGIMSRLVVAVQERGYTYFDWNVSSGDAGETTSSSGVYRNVVNGLSLNRSNVVLMHDASGKTYTVQALRNIIRYGKNHGYAFAAISGATGAVVHGVNN